MGNADYTKALIAVDCIIFGMREGKLQLLLFKREIEPLKGDRSLIGSFIQPEESASEAAKRVLEELTGLTEIYAEQLHCFTRPNRDIGGRVISIAYWSLIKIAEKQQEFNVEGHQARWHPLNSLPKLILDHGDMVQMAITKLRERARFYPVSVELLPNEFTLRQILKVYEAIFGRELDDRNFRKRLLNSGAVEKSGRKDMSTSKKGSFLYKFNPEVYEQLRKEGYDFGF